MFQLRAIVVEDFAKVETLLSFLPALYPGGDVWLFKREQEILGGQAYGIIAENNQGIVGILLGKAKVDKGFKISTLYINKGFRGKGVGKALIRKAIQDNFGIIQKQGSYITVPVNENYAALDSLLVGHGFSLIEYQKDRYGEGRDELVYHTKHPEDE